MNVKAIAASLAAVAIVAFAATFASQVASGPEPVVIRRGNVAEPDTLDPNKYGTTYESEIIRDLFVGLTTVGPDGKPIPGAAESWTISDDGLVYTFRLRAGMVWSDGVPFTADDVVAGLRRAMDPKTSAWFANFGYKMRNGFEVNTGKLAVEELGVRAIDPVTVEIVLDRPSPVWIALLATPIFYPVPVHVFEKFGDDWAKPANMVTNGAYTLAEWVPNDYVKLARNPLFYDNANVQIDEVYYYPTDDDAAALRRFRAGELDMNGRFPPAQYEWLKANMPDETITCPGSWISYAVFNMADPKFADPRVRRALSMAIDRDMIVERVLGNGEVAAWSLVPPVIEAYRSLPLREAAMTIDERRAEARRLLAEAGYGPGNPLKFGYSHRIGEANKRVAIAMQEMWGQIGVEVELKPSEVKVHYNTLRTRAFEAGDAGWSSPPDAEYFLYLLLTDSVEMNFGGWSNAGYDRLVHEADGTMDLERRHALYAEAESIALADGGFMPIYIPVERHLVHIWVKGYVSHPQNFHPTRFLRIERAGS